MSGILECDGVFQVPLDDGWTVRGDPGRTYDLSHDRLDVGVNISVYPRTAIGEDVDGAVLEFASHAGADPGELSVRRPPDSDHNRAFVRFEADEREWLAAFVFIADAAVLVTSNSAPGDEVAFAAGELVVAGLGPLPRRRRFGRR